MAKKREEPMTPAQHNKIRSLLLRKGLSTAQAQAVIGAGANGRSKKDMADTLITWLRSRPKANSGREGTRRNP